MKLTLKEKQVIENLVKKYGKDIPLFTLLEEDENTTTNMENVVFTIEGIYNNAYECTGDDFFYEGTIKDILEDEFDIQFSEDGFNLEELCIDTELDELVDFFFGDREEDYCIYTNVEISESVTREEVKNYIRKLKVEEFNYEDTIKEF